MPMVRVGVFADLAVRFLPVDPLPEYLPSVDCQKEWVVEVQQQVFSHLCSSIALLVDEALATTRTEPNESSPSSFAAFRPLLVPAILPLDLRQSARTSSALMAKIPPLPELGTLIRRIDVLSFRKISTKRSR